MASKDELIELVIDEVYGEMEVPEISHPAQWRAAMVTLAHSLRETGLRHMWMMHVLGQIGVNYLGPNVVDVTTRSLNVLTTAGFSMDEATRAMNAVSSYVIGITTAEAGWLSALRRSGLEEQDWMKVLGPQVIESAGDTRLTQYYMEQLERDPFEVRLENFTYGLDLILDSLQARLTAWLADASKERSDQGK